MAATSASASAASAGALGTDRLAAPPAWLRGLVLGLATAVAMWATGYLTHIRPELIPAPITFAVLLLCFGAGVIAAGLATPVSARRGPAMRAGAVTAVVASLVNLLILGSVVGNGEAAADAAAARSAFGLAAVGSVAGAVIFGGLGGLAGARLASAGSGIVARWAATLRGLDAARWRHVMVLVATSATFFVVIAGGLVTSTETGLAVPDWPNTFGSSMFAYPLENMVGGIYFEHAHRLYGALVGLCTVACAVVILATGERRRWVRGLAVVAVIMVCVQGLMGGLRVTGNLTTAVEGASLDPNLGLAIVHGIFGQCFFATMLVLAAATTRSWRLGPARPRDEPAAWRAADGRTIAAVTLGVLLLQLASGAGYRHLSTAQVAPPETAAAMADLAGAESVREGPADRGVVPVPDREGAVAAASGADPVPAAEPTVRNTMPWPAHMHLTLALVAVILCLVVGMKSWSRTADDDRPLRRAGLALNVLVVLQVLLGGAALVAVLAGTDGPTALEVLLATAHQANGALVLGSAALILVWSWRLAAPDPDVESAPDSLSRAVEDATTGTLAGG